MKKLIISIVCLCALTACSNAPAGPKQKVCTLTQGESSSTVTVTHDDKEVLKLAEETTTDMSTAGIGKELIEATLSATKAALDQVEGIVYEYEIKEDAFILHTVYDWEVIDKELLVELGVFQAVQDSLPLGEYVENMEKIGYTCK